MAYAFPVGLPLKHAFRLLVGLCALSCLAHLSLACSSRPIPKPRPSVAARTTTKTPVSFTVASTTTVAATTSTTTTTTPRPNITFPTFKCPANYDAWYCLNEATCFTVKIGDSIMYNCECAVGFMGPRCEYKELDGSYQPKRPRPMLEKASIASGATCALLLMLFVCLALYLCYDQKSTKQDYDIDDQQSACHFCNDRSCYANGGNEISIKYRNSAFTSSSSWLRQHIEAFPLGLTSVKRFNKL